MPKPEHLGGSDLQNSAAGLRLAKQRCSQASPKSRQTSLGDKGSQIQDGICSCPYTNAKNRCQQWIQLGRGTASFFPSHLGPQFCPLSNSRCVYNEPACSLHGCLEYSQPSCKGGIHISVLLMRHLSSEKLRHLC